MIANAHFAIRLGSPCCLAARRGCAQKPAPRLRPSRPRPRATPHGRHFANRFIEDYFMLQPFFAVNAGRHEFDGKMPDWSAGGIQQEVSWLQAHARAGGAVRCRQAHRGRSASSATTC